MGGHQHAADGIDERPDPVAQKLRTHGKTQGREVLFAAQGRQWLLQLNGHAHLLAGGAGIEETGFFQLVGVTQIELAHQQVKAVEVVAHGQGGHAVDAGLQELLGFAFAHLVDDVAALLLAATGDVEHRQTCKQQAMTAESSGDRG
ncbi:hypothetical protein D3C79_727230 [compost metagenome]